MKKLGTQDTKILTVRLPGEWWEKLQKMADDENPVSDLVRTAIKRMLRV